MKLFFAVLLSVLTFSAFGQQKQRVVIQVSDNDPAKWSLALNNAKNVQQDLGKDKVQIEIVAYGPGLGMLKAESKVADRLAGAQIERALGYWSELCQVAGQNQMAAVAQMQAQMARVSETMAQAVTTTAGVKAPEKKQARA